MTRFAIFVGTLTLGCAAGPAGGADAGADAPRRCRTTADCDDNIACTFDTCAAGNICQNQPIDALCQGEGEKCVPGRGCVLGACTTNGDCEDNIDCTIDTCGVSYTCENRPVNELCGVGESCDPAQGCVFTGNCRTAQDCQDDHECTVDECGVDFRCVHTPIHELCGEGRVCDGLVGCYPWRPCSAHADCEGLFNFCDGMPRCDPEFGCRPPITPRHCDDSDECTTNTCSRDLQQCVFEYDCSNPTCAVANPVCLWHGCFDIDPPISQRCAMGYVNYNFSRVCFEMRGPTLAVKPTPAGTLTRPLTMAPGPTGTEFDAFLEIAGGCTEHYRLAGRMTDGNSFEAEWTANYIDHDGFSCALGACPVQSISVRGTRVP